MSSTFLLAWLGYLVPTFALGYLWHLVLFKNIYRQLGIFSRIDDPIVPLGFAAMLLQGAVLAYLYPYVRTGHGVWYDGLRFGLLFGLFIASSAVLAEAAKQRVTSLGTWLVVETSYYLIQFCLVGVVIAAIWRRTI